MIQLSILDLSPILEGGDAAQSLNNSRDLAAHAEQFDYCRYWLAEHHNMPGIASAATAVVIGHVAAGTSTIRIGAGGIMLPNHAPLMVAEAFGTLASLYPGRIDLGVGRAPGTDQITSQALRRNLSAGPDTFPNDVIELARYFHEVEPGQRVRAVPGAGTNVPIWILGSSLYGAQLAAALGLPYAFASHFAPGDMDQALAIYRARFQPSEQLSEPYVMIGLNIFAADSEEAANHIFTSHQQAFVNLRSGRPGRLPPPVENFEESLDPRWRAMLDQTLSCRIVGTRETVEQGLNEFTARTGADEIMVTGQIYDHGARKRSFEIAATARDNLNAANA